MKKNILESIPWIGPKTRKKILSEYGSVSNLEKIDKKTLESHLWKKVIEALENHWII
jgi:excinuclease UvrABC nuclease subunit